MQVGLYFDLRNPPQWRQDWSRLYGFTLEMCEEAERLGAGSVWLTEHHFFEDGYMPRPLTFAAAVAARTRRIRIGTAVVLAPLYSAVQLAEEAAVVDILSGGRLELGLGAGYRVAEFAAFGASHRDRFVTADSRVTTIRNLIDEGRITPAPLQDPLPLWLGYLSDSGARRAGALGVGLLAADAALWPPYREGLIAGGHDIQAARMAGGFPGWVSDDPDRTWAALAPHVAYQVNTYLRYDNEGTDRPLPEPVDPDSMRRSDAGVDLHAFFVGTPEDFAARVRSLTQGAPVETIHFFTSIAGTPEQMVAEHVQVICNKLIPLLRDREDMI